MPRGLKEKNRLPQRSFLISKTGSTFDQLLNVPIKNDLITIKGNSLSKQSVRKYFLVEKPIKES
jgi:hypothetical protein